jgi:hypothetical protein
MVRNVTAMAQPGMNLTAPMFDVDSTLLFSVYGFGWGYRAFALPAETICEILCAANETPKQLILQAVEQKALPDNGERITLSAAGF